ncbi:hypothetical protein lerEdw1_005508 [Lerista edwardsae]|nr:hypothetical protein lerEdw1_005508 [Lerista edwardsae]
MIPGDGIGPELMLHVKELFRHACVPVDFEEVLVSSAAAEEDVKNAIMAIRRNRVALKGNIETNHNLPPSHKSRNNILRTTLDLFANVIHCKSLPGVATRHQDIDILIVRENTEGEYSSLEHESVSGVVESLKIITKSKSLRIAEYAFKLAHEANRKKVTAVHKANIMKLGDGLFLQCCREVAAGYPNITFDSMIVDNTTMQTGEWPPLQGAIPHRAQRPTCCRVSALVPHRIVMHQAAEQAYRLDRDGVEELCQLLGPHLQPQVASGRNIPALQKLLMGLHCLAIGSFQEDVAHRHAASRRHAPPPPELIVFPTAEADLRAQQETFYAVAGFPGVIGAVDATHLGILAPARAPALYRNRHHQPSLNIQATCSAQRLLTSVTTKFPSSVHDAQVFDSSDLQLALTMWPEDRGPGCDRGYPLRPSLLTLYAVDEPGPRARYNVAQRKTQLAIERAFKAAEDAVPLPERNLLISDAREGSQDLRGMCRTAQHLVSRPQQFDVMVMPNLYGNIVNNVCAGLVGGPGLVPGANYGRDYAVFETATRNTGKSIAGKNIANPTAMLLASCMMLDHLKLHNSASVIRKAVLASMDDANTHTPDIGGQGTTSEAVQSILKQIRKSTSNLAQVRVHPEAKEQERSSFPASAATVADISLCSSS